MKRYVAIAATVTVFAVFAVVAAVLALPVSAAEYVGSETCGSCHTDKAKDWLGTWHSQHIGDPKEPGTIFGNFATNEYFSIEDVAYGVGNERKQYYITKKGDDYLFLPAYWDGEARKWVKSENPRKWNEYCAKCHTAGYDAKTKTWAELNITCETCHGPGSEHVEGGGDKSKIQKSYGSEACGTCHGQIDLWKDTGHAKALKTLQGRSSATARCYECHSADYRLAPEDAKPALKDLKAPLTCAACHDPHSAANEAQLRTSVEKACVTCHNGELEDKSAFEAGKAVHHPQEEVFEGKGAIGVPSMPSLKTAECVDCHMAGGNHSFKPGTPEVTYLSKGKNVTVNACAKCHSGLTKERVAAAQKAIVGRIGSLKTRLDAVKAGIAAKKEKGQDVAGIQNLYNEAFTNVSLVESDGSKGIHNPRYLQASLGAAESRLTQAEELLK
ncbi:MAG: ammonia-forming cytochrome c nitrite reductase subunit c552 [Firmicutes bacterium]|nr:ammonia-forming cytochrome c nitrite reductase subunit c552 [Bacillota bacterium]